MKYLEQDPAVRFDSPKEAEAFHRELTELVREVTIAASRGVEDADRAVDLSRDVLKRYKTIARALNTMRRSLPRHGR